MAIFTRIDHIVILAQRLDEAMRTYQELGFQVVAGGEHPGGTHNALVAFQDGSYLELIAFQEPERPVPHRWYGFLASGGGLVDFALGADDVAAVVERARSSGLDYTGPVPGARRRPDGEELRWRLGTPSPERTGELPFVIDDVTPRELRVPGDELTRHANGVVGVRAIIVAVRDLGEAAQLYGKLFGVTPPAAAADQALEAQTVTFSVGSQRVVLAYPSGPASPIAARIQRQGDGPFEVVLAAEGRDAPFRYRPEEAEGARFLIEPA